MPGPYPSPWTAIRALSGGGGPTYPIPKVDAGRSVALTRDVAVDNIGVETSYEIPTSQALEFNGTDTRAEWKSWALLPFEDIPTQDFTVAFYAYIDVMTVTVEGVTLVHFYDDASNFFRVQIQTASSLRFCVRDANTYQTVDTVTVLSTGTWYHFALTWNAATNTVTLYVDGVAEGSQTTNTVQTSGVANSSQIGARTDENVNTFLDGRLDNVAVWDTILGPAEISEIESGGWNFDLTTDSGNYTSSASLVSWWPFQRVSPDRRAATVFAEPSPVANGRGYGDLTFVSGA